MPEMPEVETIRRVLEPLLAGETIEAAELLNAQIIAHPDAESFVKALRNQTVSSLDRRGKYLTLRFASGDRLSLHLRMTGQLTVTPRGEPVEKHTHLVMTLSGGNQLRYTDVRRFGRFWYFRADEPDNVSGQSELGLEPDDPALSAAYLKAKLGNRKKPIKEALHDQTVVAGIGNIYSDEILFAAGIYPGAQCRELDESDWARLAEKITEIILWGIKANETTAEEYLRGKGKEYRNIPLLRVYGRAGQPCAACGGAIIKTTVGGRSSCYCPNCQKHGSHTVSGADA